MAVYSRRPRTVLGTVSNTGQLPTSGNTVGDVYIVNQNYYEWNGSSWVNDGPVLEEITDAYARHNSVVKPVQEIWARKADNSVEKVWPVAQIVENFYSFFAQSDQVGAPVECTVTFVSNGDVTFLGNPGFASPPEYNWYDPITSGIGNSHYINWVVSQKDRNTEIITPLSDPNFWYPLSTSRPITFRSAEPTQVTGFISIADNPQGTNAVQSSVFVSLETLE